MFQSVDRDVEHIAPCKKVILSAIVANDVCRTDEILFACLIGDFMDRGDACAGLMYPSCVPGDLVLQMITLLLF